MADVNKKSIVARKRWQDKEYREMMLKVLKKNWDNMKGNQINKGKKLSEKHKEKISLAEKKNLPRTAFKRGHKPWNYIDGRSKLLGPARYGDDWDKIRYLIYLRDKFTCQDCGIKGIRLDVHHKVPFLISFDNSLSNLITLCRSCHMKEEAKIMRELKNQKVEV